VKEGGREAGPEFSTAVRGENDPSHFSIRHNTIFRPTKSNPNHTFFSHTPPAALFELCRAGGRLCVLCGKSRCRCRNICHAVAVSAFIRVQPWQKSVATFLCRSPRNGHGLKTVDFRAPCCHNASLDYGQGSRYIEDTHQINSGINDSVFSPIH
jgi:hypothetical protein